MQRTNDGTAPPESIQVNIFNQVYSLRSQSGVDHVRRVARLVDDRMRLIASQLATHDVAKVAVLAALNIADELEGLRGEPARGAAEEAGADSGAPRGGAPEQGREADGPQSWFEAIFDAEESARDNPARPLSGRFSDRLRPRRAPGPDSLAIESGDEEDDER